MPASPLYLCGAVDSVLDTAHALAAEACLPVWSSVLSGSQRCGRGQLRREWASPPGNIYAALRLPLAKPFAGNAAALIVGTLLADAFAMMDIPCLIKWPNDLVLHTARGNASARNSPLGKTGGILLEERAGALIAGIGINVASAPSCGQIRAGALPAACLHDLPQVSQRGQGAPFEIWTCLVDAFMFCYHQNMARGFHAWQANAEQRLVWKGEAVFLENGERRCGILLGLAASGGIRLDCDGVEKEFCSGSLSSVA